MTAIDAIAQRLELQRRRNPSMGGPDSRDRRNAEDVLDGLAAHGFAVVDLPDAEHIHLTRRADGTWHAVPMEQVYELDGEKLTVDAEGALLMVDERPHWADVSAQGDDR